MKVIVLGSGVIGTATAYFLARSGAQVRVLERQPGVALETSFANAGQISPGYSTPWAAPDIPPKALKWLFQRHSPLSIRPDGSLFQLQWMLSMLRNCTLARYSVNKERMMRLAEYSRDCLDHLRKDIDIQYEGRARGNLQLFRSRAQMRATRRDTAVLEECGVPFELIERDQLERIEPALQFTRDKFVGGLHLPNDESGDCQMFTRHLHEAARRLGVDFRFNQSVSGFVVGKGRRIAAIAIGEERLEADQYVLAGGSYSRGLLLPLGLEIPVYPVKGYSLTLPLRDESHAPVATVMDESYKVAITRFDQRIRVGGMAELGGFDLRLNPRRRETLEMVVNDLFPGGGDTAQADFWTGLRPMTPDGTPIIGATPYDNLFLNTGHGTLGWTMSCGSGRLLADLMLGRTPEIRTEGLSMARYGRRIDKGIRQHLAGGAA